MWKKVRCAAAGLRVPPSGRVKKYKSCLSLALFSSSPPLREKMGGRVNSIGGEGGEEGLEEKEERSRDVGSTHLHDLPNGR